MKQRGYVLIEMLAACVLFALAGTLIFRGLIQGMKAEAKARSMQAVQMHMETFWMTAAKDLRNAVYLRDYFFSGKEREMTFPVFMSSPESECGLKQVRYSIQNGNLVRSEIKLPRGLDRSEPPGRTVLKGVKNFTIEYPYLGDKEEAFFRPFWLEHPYFGIPLVLKIEIVLKDSQRFERMIQIPQGKWGHLIHE